ncbi:MAG: hypothetical protein EXS00_02975 [Phycisphaerales bacterium]|nr:hypothetical protein [Phycisphaerales bacterium]
MTQRLNSLLVPCIVLLFLGGRAQDATYSTVGPPTITDPNLLPSGVGFGGTPAIVSSSALLNSAALPASVHYHLHGSTDSSADATAAAGGGSAASAAGGGSGFSPYSGETMTHIPVASNWQWNYYSRTGVTSPNMHPMGSSMLSSGGSDNYSVHVYDNGAGSGFIPAIDNRFAGSGDFLGNFDPYARGGAGYVQGFD